MCSSSTPNFMHKDIMIFHWRQWKWQTHFAFLQEISLLSLASFCQSRAVQMTTLRECVIPRCNNSKCEDSFNVLWKLSGLKMHPYLFIKHFPLQPCIISNTHYHRDKIYKFIHEIKHTVYTCMTHLQALQISMKFLMQVASVIRILWKC